MFDNEGVLLFGHFLHDAGGTDQGDGGAHALQFLLLLVLLLCLLNIPIEFAYGGLSVEIVLFVGGLLVVLGHVGTVDQFQDLPSQLARYLYGLVVSGELLAALLADRRRFLREDVIRAPGALQYQFADQHRRMSDGIGVNVLRYAYRELTNAAIHI